MYCTWTTLIFKASVIREGENRFKIELSRQGEGGEL